ncbi:MAG: hypothetical protein KC777_25075 [Cyanobacteria bacterium HKST-UBA02]|nr:hypothetical protein [Cyanobacteria bacterium HKST-UBA02]
MSHDEIKQSPLRRAVISLFIVFYMVAVILWVCPWSRVQTVLTEPFAKQMFFMGCWQGFAVFAPDPRMDNVRIYATVTFDDGTKTVWNFPAMENLGFYERYRREHYRKFCNDCLISTELLWPDFARFVARRFDEPEKHPVSVALTRVSADILPIEKGLGKPDPELKKEYQFYLYRVLPEDLR